MTSLLIGRWIAQDGAILGVVAHLYSDGDELWCVFIRSDNTLGRILLPGSATTHVLRTCDLPRGYDHPAR